jgi:hypothetical protein
VIKNIRIFFLAVNLVVTILRSLEQHSNHVDIRQSLIKMYRLFFNNKKNKHARVLFEGAPCLFYLTEQVK